MALTKHIHHVHKPYQAHHPNQMHAQVITHDLPHNTTTPMDVHVHIVHARYKPKLSINK